MALPQQKFRELVFQLLYSRDISPAQSEATIPLLMQQLSITRKNVYMGMERVNQIFEQLAVIDSLIAKTSYSYAFERIQSVERNVLRLGVFELLYDPQIPPKVAVAEAIRLAKKFGSPESTAFVNAILDHIFKKSEGYQVDLNELAQTAQTLVVSEAVASEAAIHPECVTSLEPDEEADEIETD